MTIDLEKAREEIVDLFGKYPDRQGTMPDGECAYFSLDGLEMNGSVPIADEALSRLEPVCIIGHWVHEKHPELLSDPDWRSTLIQNTPLSAISEEQAEKLGLTPDAFKLLSKAQWMQDMGPEWGTLKDRIQEYDPKDPFDAR